MRTPSIRLSRSVEEAKKKKKMKNVVPPPPPPPPVSSPPSPPPPPPSSSASPALGMVELRTDEINPSNFQIAIPSAQEVERYARVCLLMEELENLSNTKMTCVISSSSAPRRRSVIESIQEKRQRNNILPSPGRRRNMMENDTVSMTSLETFSDSDGSPPSLSSSSHGGRRKSLWKGLKGSRRMDEAKMEMVGTMVDRLFSSVYDLAVEHCFVAPAVSSADGTNNHITVFSSDVLRQFIVCYNREETGMAPSEIRLLDALKKNGGEGTETKSNKTKKQQQQQQRQKVDSQLHSVLDDLTSCNPFYDVVFAGHGPAAAASVRSSIQYAAKSSMIRVQSFTYGWTTSTAQDEAQDRSLAHTLPNLCILRVENGHDVSGDDCRGVGHVLQLDIDKNELQGASPRSLSPRSSHSRQSSGGCVDLIETSRRLSLSPPHAGGDRRCSGGAMTPLSLSVSEPARLSTPARLYKFGQDSANAKALMTSFRGRALCRLGMSPSMAARGMGSGGGGTAGARGKMPSPLIGNLLAGGGNSHPDHALTSYIASLECFTTLRFPWVNTFVGEEGDGVTAAPMTMSPLPSCAGHVVYNVMNDEMETRHVV